MARTAEDVYADWRVETELGMATKWAPHPTYGKWWIILDSDPGHLRVLDARRNRRRGTAQVSGRYNMLGHPVGVG